MNRHRLKETDIQWIESKDREFNFVKNQWWVNSLISCRLTIEECGPNNFAKYDRLYTVSHKRSGLRWIKMPIKKENRSLKATFGLLRAGDLGLEIQNDIYGLASRQKAFQECSRVREYTYLEVECWCAKNDEYTRHIRNSHTGIFHPDLAGSIQL